ncbi:hypothetical protein CRENBAI_010856, partial [Crenichthys baileyi]
WQPPDYLSLRIHISELCPSSSNHPAIYNTTWTTNLPGIPSSSNPFSLLTSTWPLHSPLADFLHPLQSTESNCVIESSQQRPCLYNVEWSSLSQSGTMGPHHRGYSSNVEFGRPTERAAPPHSYGG